MFKIVWAGVKWRNFLTVSEILNLMFKMVLGASITFHTENVDYF